MRNTLKAAAVVAMICALNAAPASAQATGSVNVTARVLAALSLTSYNTLAFGNIVVGSNATVAPTAAGAGSIQTAGTAGQTVLVTITPGTFAGVNAPTFSATYANQSATVAGAPNCTTAAVYAGSLTNAPFVLGGVFPAAGYHNFCVGGTVSTVGTTAPGNYSTTVDFSVVYQ